MSPHEQMLRLISGYWISQAVYVALRRVRVREAAIAFGVVLVAGTPFWLTDLVLAGRFDVGVGPGGTKLKGPLAVLRYLRMAAGDFSSGYASVEAMGIWMVQMLSAGGGGPGITPPPV